MENLNSYNNSTRDDFRNSLLLKNKKKIYKTEQQYLNELDTLHSKSQFAETEILARKFLQDFKQSPNGYNFLGLSQFGQKKNNDAIKSYKKAFSIQKDGVFLNNLGLLYIDNSENKLALETFKQASKLNPGNVQIRMNLATAFEKNGDLENSYVIRKKILEIDPSNTETIFRLHAMPNATSDDINHYIEQMKVLHEKSPENLSILENLISALVKKARLKEALNFSVKSLAIEPMNDIRYANIAIILKKLNKIPESKKYLTSAIKLNPRNGDHWLALGWIEHQYGKIYHAIELYKKSIIHLKDDHKGWPLNNIANAYIRIGENSIAHKYYMESQKYTNNYDIYQNYMCNLSYISDDLKNIYDEHRKYTKKFDNKSNYTFLEKQKNKVNNKIRVGYFSPDFRVHSVAFFFNQLLCNHNKDKFDIILYSNRSGRPDEITSHFKSTSTKWRDVQDLNDDQIIKLIQNDNINILVDLIGNFAGGRSTIFARKPAPIQINYLGYVTTTGLKSMDYRFTTFEADPNKSEDKFYSEKLIRLPNTFLCYTGSNVYSVNNPPFIMNKVFTFGSFNNISKITPKTIKAWSSLLNQNTNSRFLLKSSTAADNLVNEQLLKKFEKQGVDRSRINILTKTMTGEDHLKLYNHIDIAVDTFPFNGATTTLEALWMGVPVLTITGKTHHGRVSTSVLKVLKMESYIAVDENDFVRKGSQAILNTDELIYLRKNLRDNIKKSYLCNGALFAKNIEKEYFKMFDKIK